MLEETLNDLSLLKVLQYLCHRQKEIISMQPKSRGAGGEWISQVYWKVIKNVISVVWIL